MELQPTIVYDAYWEFAYKRQNIFFDKLKSINSFSSDSIISKYKFTNCYRVLDRTSQFLIKEVIYSEKRSSKNTFFRIMLFKLFNKIDTWHYLEQILGAIEVEDFNIQEYSKILNQYSSCGNTIYSGAYIMASAKSAFGHDRKYLNHLCLIKQMLDDEVYESISECNQLNQVYNILITYPSIGPFLAYQYSIDLNYSTILNCSEMNFVKAGPGALSGIAKCFSNSSSFLPEDIIKYVSENQKNEFKKRSLQFKDLFGRKLQLIDCQNLFCEIDKYARVAYPTIPGIGGRTRIKRMYRPKANKINYSFPPKWDINQHYLEYERKL